jgi:crotonobetainyl-CoA:carnitine CoA-transferase CaiB-like acyl-CoA transferase
MLKAKIEKIEKRMLSGLYASMLLSDLGADVVKVEQPLTGDIPRNGGPFIKGISSYSLSINRGKRSITVDMRRKNAKEIIFNLAKKVDILIENFLPGVMKRVGLDYKTICEHNPRIIYASISGFGQNGPYARRAAFDMIAQGMGGVLSITGEAGTREPPGKYFMVIWPFVILLTLPAKIT